MFLSDDGPFQSPLLLLNDDEICEKTHHLIDQ